jgi:4-hydroxy-2-oxoheptanedioate aldolase
VRNKVPVGLRELWDSSQATVGGWCRIPSAFSAEVVARAGFDWVCVDMQHGLAGQDTMVSMLQALDACGVPGIVRVPWNDPASIMRALDVGAQGIVVPMVNSADDARKAAKASHYPPVGYRSWGPSRASLGREGYSVDSANASVVCMVMVETREAIENLDDILSVDGVDGAYVGPSDLAISCGLPPNDSEASEPLAGMIGDVVARCRNHDLVAGIHCSKVAVARLRASEGFRMMAVANDASLLSASSAAVVTAFHDDNRGNRR